MISKGISDKVIVIGTSPEGRGGIATVIKSQSAMMETFNFVKIHQDGFSKYILPITAAFKCLRYISPKYKIAHIHSASFSDFFRCSIFVMLMKALGKKVVLHIHGAKFEEFYKSRSKAVSSVCNHADATATVSTHFVSFLRNNNLGRKVFYIPNSIDDYSPVRKPKTSEGPLILSYFGALDDRKGIFETIEAIGRNKQQFEGKIELHIGGIGEMTRMEHLISQYGISDMIKYHGWLDADGKNRLLQKSDVFVHPSIFESFGISILEAMNYGLPIITTDVGGITDLVSDGENGITVNPRNVDDISEAIEWMLAHPVERSEMGIKSAEHAHKFHASNVEKCFEKMYIELLTQSK